MANPTVTPIMTPARGPNVPDAQPIYGVDVYGNPITGAGGATYAEVAASTTPTTVVNRPGKIFGAAIVTSAASAETIYDGATGNVLISIPASAAAGTFFPLPAVGVIFNTSLIVSGATTAPAIVVFYS